MELVNGRSVLFYLCKNLSPPTVWLPSYICSSLVEVLKFQGVDYQFYPVDLDLRVGNREWIQKIRRQDLVLFIDYFGFDLHRSAIPEAKLKGAWILQDAAQGLLSNYGRPQADFVLYSPKKFIGVPDGGIIQILSGSSLLHSSLNKPPRDFLLSAMNAFFARSVFDQTGTGNWYQLYQESEKLNPIGFYGMSELSSALLRNAFNFPDVALQRRQNYQALLNSLGDISLLGELPPDTVPLGFPIVTEKRDAIRERLYANKIYCPLHWPLKGVVPDSFDQSHQLNRRMLTLLCDQRCRPSDMERMVKIIKEFL